MILFEKERGADRKLCGEFLSPRGVAALAELGLAGDAVDCGAIAIPRWSLASGRGELSVRFPSPGLALSRARLDPLLRRAAERAGATVREGTRVSRVERTAGTHVLHGAGIELARARTVLAASGRAARIPGLTEGTHAPGERDAGARPEPAARFVAWKAHVRDAAAAEIRSPRVALYGLRGAYVGVVPLGAGIANVCFLARRGVLARGTTPASFLDREAARSTPWGIRWRRLEVSGADWIAVSAIDFERRPLLRERGLFAGDSAAVIPPLLGEGMALALESGALAADAVLEILKGSTEDAAATRLRRAWRKRQGARHELGRLLQRILFSRSGTHAAVALLAAFPVLATHLPSAGTPPTSGVRAAQPSRSAV